MSHPFYSTNDLQNIKGNYGALLWELHQGAAYGDIDRVRECLDAGADINGQNPDFGVTALMLAAAGGYLEIGKLLLDRGADSGIVDRSGRAALDWAIYKHWDDFAELIRGRLSMPKKTASESKSSLRMGEDDTNAPVFEQTLGNVSGVCVKCWRDEYREVLGAHLYFDCWRPSSDDTKKLPFVILVHGGGWDGGDRNDPSLASIGNALLAKGFAVATIDYRLAWTWRFPDPLADLKAAVRYFRANADEYGIDPERIGVFGHSAGAHLALLLGLTSAAHELEKFSGDASISSSVRAVCGISCPCDFKALIDVGRALRDAVNAGTPSERKGILSSLKGQESLSHILSMMDVFDFPLKYRDLSEKETALLWQRKFDRCRPVRLVRGLVHVEDSQTLLEKEDDLLRASPMRYAQNPQVDGPAPSFLLLHGANDPVVSADECYRFQSVLREHKVDVDIRVDPNSTDWHGGALYFVPRFFERTLKYCVTPNEVIDEALLRRIVGKISSVLGKDEHQIRLDSSFSDDLGALDFEFVDIVVAFEEEFGVEIPEQLELTTVAVLYKYLKENGCGTTGEGVTVAASGLTPTASGEVIGKNSPKNKKRKSASATSDKNRPKGKKRTNESPSSEQSKFEYNDKDRFIVRLFERMIEASNHNPIVEKSLSFVKRFFKDDLSDGEGFSLTIEADSGVYGGGYSYEFYLNQDELVISEIIPGGFDLGPWVSGCGAIGNFLWELKAGFHVSPGHEEGEIEEGVISLLKHGAFIY